MQRASFHFTPRGGSSTHRSFPRAAALPSAAEEFEAEGTGETLSAYARIDNLLDRRYQSPTGFLRPGLGVFAGLRLALDPIVPGSKP